MKKTRLLAVLLVALILTSCGGGGTTADTTAAETTTEITIAETTSAATEINLAAAADAVKNGADYSAVTFVGKDDQYSTDSLYVYFGEDMEIYDALDDFAVTEMLEMTVKTMAIFRFKDGTSEEIITRAKKVLSEEYVASAVSSVKLYDPSQEEVANAYTIRDYGELTFAFVIYGDKAANEQIFSLIESAK